LTQVYFKRLKETQQNKRQQKTMNRINEMNTIKQTPQNKYSSITVIFRQLCAILVKINSRYDMIK